MAESFEKAYPSIAGWVEDGGIELGRDDFSRSFIRVLDKAAIKEWLEEN